MVIPPALLALLALLAPLPRASRLLQWRRRLLLLLLHLSGLMLRAQQLLLAPLPPPAAFARRLVRLRTVEHRGHDHIQARGSDAAMLPPVHRVRLLLACVMAGGVPAYDRM